MVWWGSVEGGTARAGRADESWVRQRLADPAWEQAYLAAATIELWRPFLTVSQMAETRK